MNAICQKQDDGDKRVCDRLSLDRMVKITFPDERELLGSTVNVSLGGLLIRTTQQNDGMLLGQTAQIQMLSSDGRESDGLACKVIRVAADLLGLAIDKKTSMKLCKALTAGFSKVGNSGRENGEP